MLDKFVARIEDHRICEVECLDADLNGAIRGEGRLRQKFLRSHPDKSLRNANICC